VFEVALQRMTSAEEDAHNSHTWWLGIVGLVVSAFGVVRMLLIVSATVLGTSQSCGNAVGWLSGGDNTSSTVLSVCGAPLHNASVLGMGSILVGVALLLAWLVMVHAYWLLVTLVGIVVIILGGVAGYFIGAFVVALLLLVAFGTWRAIQRSRSPT